MALSLWTVYGNSDRSYGVTKNDPFQGVFQVNGAGTGIWICICSFLVEHLCQQFHVLSIVLTTLQELMNLADIIFFMKLIS